jgi:hypothetical protein
LEEEDKLAFDQLFKMGTNYVTRKMLEYTVLKPVIPKPKFAARPNNTVTVISADGSMAPTVYGIQIHNQHQKSVQVSGVLSATSEVRFPECSLKKVLLAVGMEAHGGPLNSL